jgi:hypothetical protein
MEIKDQFRINGKMYLPKPLTNVPKGVEIPPFGAPWEFLNNPFLIVSFI